MLRRFLIDGVNVPHLYRTDGGPLAKADKAKSSGKQLGKQSTKLAHPDEAHVERACCDALAQVLLHTVGGSLEHTRWLVDNMRCGLGVFFLFPFKRSVLTVENRGCRATSVKFRGLDAEAVDDAVTVMVQALSDSAKRVEPADVCLFLAE